MNDDLAQLSKRLQHSFKDFTLLEQALRHRSVGSPNNERLEFLGDAILGFVISVELYQRYPNAQEGELSRMRSSVVNGDVLAKLALTLGIHECLELGLGERKSGGAERQSILADALEATLGAIYLDAGIEATKNCILHWYGKEVDNLSQLLPVKDAKSQLQEWLQGHQYPLPHYVAEVSGQAHALSFKVVCSVAGLPYRSEGISTSRRKAEQIAAEKYLEFLDGK